MSAAVQEGGPLAGVMKPCALREVDLDLANADNAALGLGLVGADPPIPDLCGLAKALAAEGEAVTG